jgi:hypothetical protein
MATPANNLIDLQAAWSLFLISCRNSFQMKLWYFGIKSCGRNDSNSKISRNKFQCGITCLPIVLGSRLKQLESFQQAKPPNTHTKQPFQYLGHFHRFPHSFSRWRGNNFFMALQWRRSHSY